MEKDNKKKTTKKNEKVKPTVKKAETKTTKKEVVKAEVKKEEVKETLKVEKKKGIFSKILGGLKKFFNSPTPLFIAFIVIIAGLLLFIQKNITSSTILVGEIQSEELQVPSIHLFTNNDMNYFFASTALYGGEHHKTKIYNYQVGYFVVTPSKEYVQFATRSNKLDAPVDVKTLIDEMGAWDFGEAKSAEYFFTKEVVKNIDNLHFVFRGSTSKDSDEADVLIDVPVELSKITKN